jgi:hypothetical protein
MQEKHKVTLYLSPDLHRQLKIKAAVSSDAMSDIAQRAIDFYLTHSDIVERVDEAHGRTHQIYNCPECRSAVVIREGELVTLGSQPTVVADGLSDGSMVDDRLAAQRMLAVTNAQGEELVPC